MFEINPIDPKLKKQLLEFQERLGRDVAPFSDTSRDAIRKRFDKSKEFTYFAKEFLPHYVDADFCGMHHDIVAMMQQPSGVFPTHGPREHGKSTITRANIIRRILTGQNYYVVIGSETLGLAVDHCLFIMIEFLDNDRIQSDYEIDVKQFNTQKGKFDLVIRNKSNTKKRRVRLQAVSYETSSKGLLFMNRRPDLALVDDFENTRTAKNSRIAGEKVDWVVQELYPAVKGPVVWLGNTAFETSALYQVMRSTFESSDAFKRFLKQGSNPGELSETGIPFMPVHESTEDQREIYPYSFRADRQVDGVTQYLWPQNFAPGWYQKKRATMGYRYEGEYNGYPVKVGKIFTNIHRTDDLSGMDWWYFWFDPAWGRSKSSSYKSGVVLASDGHRFVVAGAYCRQGTPMSAAIDAIYELFLKFEPHGLTYGGYEGVFGQDERLEQDLDLAEEKKGYRLNIYPHDNKGDKDARIQSLEGPINSGMIQFVEGDKDVETIIEQLIGYPDLEYKDGPDSLEAAFRKLRQLSRRKEAGTVKVQSQRRFRFRRHSK
jgi:phage terminase large subunit-like protein